jgi:hypothetical protein
MLVAASLYRVRQAEDKKKDKKQPDSGLEELAATNGGP